MKKSTKSIFIRIFSLFIHLRLANLFVLLVALYFSAAYLFSNKHSLLLIFYDFPIHSLIWSSVLSVGAGYLINYFYDLEKDKISKPFTFHVKSFIKTSELLQLYSIINIISLLLVGFISLNLLLFFVLYQFLIWFYCHKLSKLLFINNLIAVFLSLYPFLGLLIYYGNFDLVLVELTLFLTFFLFLKEVVKDVHSITSDSLFNYKTLPSVYGMNASKFNFILLVVGVSILSLNLFKEKSLHFMRLYFLLSSFILIIPTIVFFIQAKKYAHFIEIFIKIWLGIGIFSIALIKIELSEIQKLVNYILNL